MLIRCYTKVFTLHKQQTFTGFNMYLEINECITALMLSNFSRHYLCNRLTLDIGVFGSIGVV